MTNYLSRIKKIKDSYDFLKKESFTPALSGTNYKVFVSDNYIIRFRDDDPKLLLREVEYIKQLNHPLIPKVLLSDQVDESFFMIENRLPGQTVDLTWKDLSADNKENIIGQVVEFLLYQKTQTREYIYSVKTGKKYKSFLDYLIDGIEQKITKIKRFEQARGIIGELLLIINDLEIRNLFTFKKEISLVHGDLIIHNLLTDGKKLTGVLDWELALWGDSDYDLFRLFYYQECAKAYQEQGVDHTFESDYMDRLIVEILKSDLIKDKNIFQKKYELVRAIFYLNALYWASDSDSPEKNIDEIMVQWDKKNGTKHFRV